MSKNRLCSCWVSSFGKREEDKSSNDDYEFNGGFRHMGLSLVYILKIFDCYTNYIRFVEFFF